MPPQRLVEQPVAVKVPAETQRLVERQVVVKMPTTVSTQGQQSVKQPTGIEMVLDRFPKAVRDEMEPLDSAAAMADRNWLPIYGRLRVELVRRLLTDYIEIERKVKEPDKLRSTRRL
jgi:hypothetical protein